MSKDGSNAGLEDRRRQLWIGVAVAVARAESAKDPKSVVSWANVALAGFDANFKQESKEATAPQQGESEGGKHE